MIAGMVNGENIHIKYQNLSHTPTCALQCDALENFIDKMSVMW